MSFQVWIVALAFFILIVASSFLHRKYVDGKAYPIIYRSILLGLVGLTPTLLALFIGLLIGAMTISDYLEFTGVACGVYLVLLTLGWMVSSLGFIIIFILSRISIMAKKKGYHAIHIKIRHMCVFLYRTFIKVNLPYLNKVMSRMYSSQSNKKGEWLREHWKY